MPRMREVGRPVVRSRPVAAHEWDRGQAALGTVAECGVAFSSEPVTTTVNRGGDMSERRLVGIDLGIASAHAVRVLDGEGVTLVKRKALPTVESLSEIETAALVGTAAGSRLEVVIEPTGPAW